VITPSLTIRKPGIDPGFFFDCGRKPGADPGFFFAAAFGAGKGSYSSRIIGLMVTPFTLSSAV
jgi:hypothetical protein